MTRPFVLITLLSALFAGCAPAPRPAPIVRNDSAIKTMHTALDQQQQVIEKLRLRMDQLEQDVSQQQQQLGSLQATLAAQKVTYGGENTATPRALPAAGNAATAASASKIYLRAFSDYASTRYQEAISGFNTFLNRFPTNNYAGNAQFWLGECYYNLGQYNRAVQEYQKVLDNYPLSGKAPDALLHMAPALRQLNQYEKARQALQALQQRYPDSSAARKAQTAP